MNKLDAIAEVYKGDVNPDDWVVWASDLNGDGEIVVAIFAGVDAEVRAVEYAEAKFAEVLRHAPDQRPCRLHPPRSEHGGLSPSRGANLRLVKSDHPA